MTRAGVAGSLDPSQRNTPSPAAGIKGPAIRASMWALGGFAASQALRLLSNLVLARLLFPAAFGQMALVSVFIQGLQMFSDVGTGTAIVQSPRGDDRRFLDTAWTVQCARGLFLWLCAWLVARPVAAFYGDPLLAWLIPAAGLYTVFGGFESTTLFAQQRHLKLERVTVIELATQAVIAAVMIAWALADRAVHGPDHPGAVWALVVGTLAGSTTRLVLSHTALPGPRNRFRLERESLRALFTFGKWVFVSTMLGFLAGQADRLVLGKMIPLDLLGMYGVAATLAALPTQAALKLAGSVVLPAYSRLAARTDFGDVFARVRLPLLILAGAAVSGLLGCGPLLVRFLYDDRWVQAGWILQFLAAGAWFQVLESANGAALIAHGRVSWVAAGSSAKLAGMLLLLPLGFYLAGFPGALAGLAASELARYAASSVGVRSRGLGVLLLDGSMTALVAGTSCGSLLLGRAAATASGHDLVGLLAGAAVPGAVFGALALRYVRWGSGPPPGEILSTTTGTGLE